MTRAVVFVKTGDDFEPHADRCLDYCEQRGYHFQGIIRDDWSAVEKMLGTGETSVVIVSTEAHLDPDRRPRIEVVNNQPAATRWEARTRIIRRDGAR